MPQSPWLSTLTGVALKLVSAVPAESQAQVSGLMPWMRMRGALPSSASR